MFKTILSSLLLATILFAAPFEDNIIKLLEKQTNTKIKIIKNETLKENNNLSFLIIEIIEHSQRIPIFATKDGNTIIGLSNIFFTNSTEDENMIQKAAKEIIAYNEKNAAKAEDLAKVEGGKLVEQLKPEQYISFQSNAKNPKTYFIVADPNCGYCREEFKNINEKLKTHNVNMVIVGILGEDSQKKAAYVMNKIDDKTSQKDKMNALQEIFSTNFKTPKTIDVTKINDTTSFLFKSGLIRGVPFIHETK